MNFTFKNINDNQELLRYKEQILTLFREAFGSNLSGDLWDWAYQKNPAGPAYVSLCFDDEVLAGHYAVIPVILEKAGMPFKAALSMTTMVGKKYQGKGLFTRQAEMVYDLLKADEVSMVIGFPNKNSAPGFKKRLEWNLIDCSRIVKLSGAEIKSNPKIKAMLEGRDKVCLNLSEEYLLWRMLKPASAYNQINKGLIVKAFEDMQDIVYLSEEGARLLEDDVEYNVYIDFEDDNIASSEGFSYKFGYRIFDDEYAKNDIKVDLLMSDVF